LSALLLLLLIHFTADSFFTSELAMLLLCGSRGANSASNWGGLALYRSYCVMEGKFEKKLK